MNAQRFACSRKRQIIYGISFAAASLIWLIPFGLIWFGRGFRSAVRDYFIDMPSHPFVFILFTSFSGLLILVRVYNASLRYPVLINDEVILQFPWIGTRRIEWADAERIQIFRGVNGSGQDLYRIRIFSRDTVIVVTGELEKFEELVRLVEAQAIKRGIPLYLEQKISTTVRFGSWQIDASGNSAGVPVSRIERFPPPKEEVALY